MFNGLRGAAHLIGQRHHRAYRLLDHAGAGAGAVVSGFGLVSGAFSALRNAADRGTHFRDRGGDLFGQSLLARQIGVGGVGRARQLAALGVERGDGLRQLADGALKRFGDGIEAVGDLAELILAVDARALAQVAGGQFAGALRQAGDGGAH